MTTSSTTTQTPPAKPAKAAKKAEPCAVPDCRRKPKKRGLCDAHWDTHRGLATPKDTATKDTTDD